MQEQRSGNHHRKSVKRCRSKGISVVLTTMIILVASVILAVGVVIYGTSLFKTGTLQEVITIRGATLWVNATNATGTAWGVAGVRNSGDKLVSVDTIILRGASVPFTQWYYDKDQNRVTIENFQDKYLITRMDLQNGMLYNSTSTDNCSVGNFALDFDGAATGKPTLCLSQAQGPISLAPGERMIVYFNPNSGLILPIDSGTATNISIFAGRTGAPITTVISTP